MRRYFIWFVVFCLLAYSYAYAGSIQDLLLVPPYYSPPIKKSYNVKSGILVKRILVQGNHRITLATILAYLGFHPNDRVNQLIINQGLKNLYDSGLFLNAYISRKNGIIVVRVIENPLINQLVFEGNHTIPSRLLSKQILLREGGFFDRGKAIQDIQTIMSIYHKSGYFNPSVILQVIPLSNNRINLVYKIHEGYVTRVKSIYFIGNHFFSSNILKDIINTKEDTWYRFLSSSPIYDPDKMSYDEELLRRYYLSYGFVDFHVTTGISEYEKDNNGFIITFALSEGSRYHFGKIEIISHIGEISNQSLKRDLIIHQNDWYSSDSLQESIKKMNADLFIRGYPFIQIQPEIIKNPIMHTVSIILHVQKGNPLYVDKINITGNTVTLDSVIRRELTFTEGDPYNNDLIAQSKNNLENLGFFHNVSIDSNFIPNTPAKRIINIHVSEIPTTSVMLSGGYSTDSGFLLGLGYSDSNLFGSGHSLSIQTQIGYRNKGASINYSDPYFHDTNMSFNGSVSYSNTNYRTVSGYCSRTYGSSVSLGYMLLHHVNQSFTYSLSRDHIYGIMKSTSSIIKSEEGKRTVSTVSQVLTYSNLNSSLWPTNGYSLSWTSSLSGIPAFPDVKTWSNIGTVNIYHPIIFDNLIGWFFLESGHIQGLDGQSVAVQDRFLIGGETLRGFEFGGIGPRDLDTRDALGGNSYQRGTAQLLFPLGTPKEFGLFGDAFFDAGRLYGLTINKKISPHTAADHSLHTSVGIGIRWRSPVGFVMKLDYVWPLKHKPYDELQEIQFSIGSGF